MADIRDFQCRSWRVHLSSRRAPPPPVTRFELFGEWAERFNEAHPFLSATGNIVIYGGIVISVLGIALVRPDLRSGQVKRLFPVIGILLNAFFLLVFGAIMLASMLS